jgi:hypothetical protein
VTRFTTASQTTLDAIIHGFDEFQKTVAPNDMVVLFYAGHGMGLSDGTYLVPADVREASLQVEATAKRATISESELTDGLRRVHAGIVAAVIDACRNDLFSRAAGRSIGNGRGLRPAETGRNLQTLLRQRGRDRTRSYAGQRRVARLGVHPGVPEGDRHTGAQSEHARRHCA